MKDAFRSPRPGTTRSHLRTHTGPGLLLLAALGACQQDPDDGEDLRPTTQPDMALPPEEARPRPVPLSATGHDRFFSVAYEPQGSFYAAGAMADTTEANADFRMVVAHFTAAGVLDISFGTGGHASLNVAVGTGGELARSVVVQSTGKIVVSGTVEHAGAADPRDRDVALVRFQANGALDKSFGRDGVAILDLSDGEVSGTTYIADAAWGLARDSADRLLVHAAQRRSGATDTDFAVVRLTPEGAVDTTFGNGGTTTLDINNRSASPRSITLLADGSIVGAGYMNDGGPVKPVLYKLDAGGKLDTTFGVGGTFTQGVLAATTEAYAAAVQGTSLVTTGYGRNEASESLDWVSLRLTGAGALDTGYGTGGFVRIDVAGFNDNSRNLLVLPDNRVMLIGGGRPTETNTDAMIAVLTPDGGRDTSFAQSGYKLYDLGGSADFFWGAELSPQKTHVAVVGVKSSGADPGNDDAVVLVLPLAR